MKFNKWTLGLAAVGAVSLTSAARAEEKPNYLQTSVATTTLSGYVDTSINWNIGTGDANVPGYAYNTPAKQDGFNLNSVKVTLNKAEDDSEWASGYNVDLFMGPDANILGTSAIGGVAGTDFAIKQAYVMLRTPIGTGIDWKLGLWDTIIGYESTEDPNNPNYTRSYGYSIEPTSHTGLQGTYKVNDMLSLTAGIANTTGPVIGGASVNPNNVGGVGQITLGRANPPKAETYKTYLASVAFTAPTNWGFISGSAFYAGFINGWSGGAATVGTTQNFYVGTTINTPLDKLKIGASYDYFDIPKQTYTTTPGATPTGVSEAYANALDLYATFQATEKMSVNTRMEYFWQSESRGPGSTGSAFGNPSKVFAITETVQYDLWKNVLSRLELRWDHQAGSIPAAGGALPGGAYGGVANYIGGLNASSNAGVAGTKRNSWIVAANVIYKF